VVFVVRKKRAHVMSNAPAKSARTSRHNPKLRKRRGALGRYVQCLFAPCARDNLAAIRLASSAGLATTTVPADALSNTPETPDTLGRQADWARCRDRTTVRPAASRSPPTSCVVI
jgi:hypothetical protein